MTTSRLVRLYPLLAAFCLIRRTAAFAPGIPDGGTRRAPSVQLARRAKGLAAAETSFGAWEDLDGGCRLLRPADGDPRALVHFLGGAFVSPQPTVAYRYVLERLAALGYAVVATPFAVDFDYSRPAADIREKFAAARRELSDVGCDSLPRMSMGHSLGALMHVLLACKFPAEHAEGVSGAALISYNNKGVDGAIPGFKEVLVPALGPLEPVVRDRGLVDAISNAQEARAAGFDLARDLARGARTALGLEDGESLIPGVDPIVLRALDDIEAASSLVDQLPDVLASIAGGASEFEPAPAEMRGIVSSSYEVSSPLVVKFTEDFIDESDALMDILPARLGARLEKLPGTHVSPLAIDPNAPSTPLLPIPDAIDDPVALRSTLLANADALVSSLDEYFSDRIADASTRNSGTDSLPLGDVQHQTNMAGTEAAQPNEPTEEHRQSAPSEETT